MLTRRDLVNALGWGLRFRGISRVSVKIGRTSKQNKDLPSFRSSIEENPTCCLSDLLIWKISGYNGVDLAEGKIRVWWSRCVASYAIDCVARGPLLGLYLGVQVSRFT